MANFNSAKTIITFAPTWYLKNLFIAVLGHHCCMGFSLVAASRGFSLAVVCGFSLWWLLLLQNSGSGALEHKLDSCGAHDVGSSWIRDWTPVSCIGRHIFFFTAEPPGKPCIFIFIFERWRGRSKTLIYLVQMILNFLLCACLCFSCVQ